MFEKVKCITVLSFYVTIHADCYNNGKIAIFNKNDNSSNDYNAILCNDNNNNSTKIFIIITIACIFDSTFLLDQ